ncbi:MAG: peroxisomal catalase, partial [Candidatus Brocadiaceae bacterium]|nr:peroxisomal catalase [Candidatus Brocadiaceae bacterium]
MVGGSLYAERRFGKFRLLFPFTVAVGLVTKSAAVVAVHPHSAIAMVAMKGTARSVHRYQMVVHAETVALGIAVREQASLQHLVRRESDAGNHIGRVEGRLLHLGEVVLRIAVQFHDADFGQRIVRVEPHLGEVEWVVRAGGGILLRHHLNEELPPREILLFNAFVKVALVALPVIPDECLGLRIGQVLDALLADQMELDPVPFAFGVDEAEGVAAESVHVVGGGYATVAHDNGDLVQGLGKGSPEVPVVAGAAQVCAWVALHGVVEVGKLKGIAQEKDGRVVPHKVPVALLRVELDGKAPDVALCICRAALPCHRGESGEKIGLLPDVGENLRFCITGDVVSDGKGAVRTRTFGVHSPLGN